MDLVVYGASERGEALCCDATLVSPLRRDGHLADRRVLDGLGEDLTDGGDGFILERARRRKEARYPELGRHGTRLVVLASEVGGRFSKEAQAFVRRLARLRCQQAPPMLRSVAQAAFARRWWALLSVAIQDALAATLLGLPAGPLDGVAGAPLPSMADVLTVYGADGCPSRLPLRG